MMTARDTEPGAARRPFTELSDEQRAIIIQELNRILNDHSFKNSKRCTVLLQGVVERALAGDYDAIKERTLAVEIFDREPGYDTSTDPIVRATANDVRKRLAQFYHQPEHQGEVRIELVPGSYTPVFSLPGNLPDMPSSVNLVTEASCATEEIPPDFPPNTPAVPQPRRPLPRMVLAGFALFAIAVAIGVSAWRFTEPNRLLKLFWDPLLKSPNPVLLCVGGMRPSPNDPNAPGPPITSKPSREMEADTSSAPKMPVLSLEDAVSLTNLSGLMLIQAKPFNISTDSDATYEYLQKGPVILIGAYDNDWTMHFSRSMRYYFIDDQNGYQWIADRKNPETKLGLHSFGVNPQDFDRVPRQDYALVGRLLDPETKQPTILVAGVTASSTLAASKFVTDSKLMGDFLKTAPRDWQNKNVELVLSVNVIANQPAPARVMASAFW